MSHGMNVQVRANADNTIEMSGSLDTNYLLDKVVGGVYSRAQVTSAFPPAAFLPGSVNLHCKASGKITSQKATGLSFKSFEVQGIGVPSNVYSSPDAASIGTNILNTFIARIQATNHSTYDFVRVQDGKLVFKGTVPSSLSRISKIG